MNIWISWGLSGVLAIIAALHFYWGGGGHWPAKKRSALASIVIGQKHQPRMPPAGITFFVAFLILGTALLPVFRVMGIGSPFWLRTGLQLLTFVFLFRGIIGYSRWFRTTLSHEPFATLNRRYYTPLCLILAAGFGTLLLA